MNIIYVCRSCAIGLDAGGYANNFVGSFPLQMNDYDPADDSSVCDRCVEIASGNTYAYERPAAAHTF